MLKRLEFYLLSNLFNGDGVLIDGDVYNIDSSSNDAFVEHKGETYSLRYEGNMLELCELEKVVKASEIKRFKQKAIEDAFSTFLGKVHNKMEGLLIFECLHDILPYLDEFDSRVNDMPKSDLVELRRKELLGELTPAKKRKSELSREDVRLGVAQCLTKLYEEKNDEDYDEDDFGRRRTRHPINEPYRGEVFNLEWFPNIFYIKTEGLYTLQPREYRGDVTFWKKGGNKHIFKVGPKIPKGMATGSINKRMNEDYIKEAACELSNEMIDAFINYHIKLKDGQVITSNDIEYQNCGMRWINMGKRDEMFVYIKPMGFSMHDIRLGHTQKWYPFPNPPEVGIVINKNQETQESLHDNNQPYVGKVVVNGDFEYLNFSSQAGHPKSFCGSSNIHQNSGETWQQATIRGIVDTAYTLYNGMNEASLIEFSDEQGILGERYPLPLSKIKWMTEKEVEEAGLLKTNMHEYVSATK